MYIFKGKFHRGFLLRLGILPKGLILDRPVWIHAVSVGEAMAVRGLIEELRKVYPKKQFIISTVTPTGNKIARTIGKEGDFITYLPLDFSFIVQNVIDKINPSLFILAETEIWPNLIRCLSKKNIPIITVNGRISDGSFKGYLMIKFLVKPILKKIRLFCVQTERDAQRLECLGVTAQQIKITGNMKFDIAGLKADFPDYKQALGLRRAQDKLLVAGSTHPGEEEIILKVYRDLSGEFPDLRLLIAPRHPERAGYVERVAGKYNFNPVRISNLDAQAQINPRTVFILDTVGQLISFYAIADIVFVGGSLIKKGGQNILEPGALGKPVLFGPHMSNFRDIAQLFLNQKAAVMVHNPQELKTGIKYLLDNPDKAGELGEAAREVILENQGATLRNIQYIKEIMPYGD